jgi:ElaB/YqjD/DUF883 family membrane-anchored ribosome-binding protein
MAGPVNRGFGLSESQRGQETGRPSSSTGGSQTGSAAGMMGTVKDKAQDVASSVMSRGEDAWDSTRQMAENVASEVATRAEDAWDSMISCMRRWPLSTFGAGVALGVLLTLALRSSRQSSWNR